MLAAGPFPHQISLTLPIIMTTTALNDGMDMVNGNDDDLTTGFDAATMDTAVFDHGNDVDALDDSVDAALDAAFDDDADLTLTADAIHAGMDDDDTTPTASPAIPSVISIVAGNLQAAAAQTPSKMHNQDALASTTPAHHASSSSPAMVQRRMTYQTPVAAGGSGGSASASAQLQPITVEAGGFFVHHAHGPHHHHHHALSPTTRAAMQAQASTVATVAAPSLDVAEEVASADAVVVSANITTATTGVAPSPFAMDQLRADMEQATIAAGAHDSTVAAADYDDGEVVVNLKAKTSASTSAPPRSSTTMTPQRTSPSATAMLPSVRDALSAPPQTTTTVLAEFDPLIPQDWMINFDSPHGGSQRPPMSMSQSSSSSSSAMATMNGARGAGDGVVDGANNMTPRVVRVPTLLDALSPKDFATPQSVAKYSERDVMAMRMQVQQMV